MNRNILDNRLSRRGFMRQAACAGLGAATMINAFSSLRLTAAAATLNSQISGFSDYKTMVCIYLAGGNDSHNMLIPLDTNIYAPNTTAYDRYKDSRKQLKLTSGLHSLTLGNDAATADAFEFYNGYGRQALGTHPSASKISTLFNNVDPISGAPLDGDSDLAFVCNVGTLAGPMPNGVSDMSPATTPQDLYSHNSQTMQWMTSIADGPSSTGWGGRVADMLHESGTSSEVPMAISLTGGSTTFLRNDGTTFSPLGITAAGAKQINELVANSPNPGDTVVRKLLELSNDHLMISEYAKKANSAYDASGKIEGTIDTLDADDASAITLAFKDTDFGLADQLEMVAKLIAANKEGSPLNNKRQIFFVTVGGYDTHDNHLEDHANLMEELSESLYAFREALKNTGTAHDDDMDQNDSQNNWDRTIAFTASDFNRTLTPNTDGLDHAWAGHHIVMGGKVQGGRIYGHFPSLDVNGVWNARPDGRGHFIPTVSVDQYSAKIAEWFGVNNGDLANVFPNLNRFGGSNSYYDGANLSFI